MIRSEKLKVAMKPMPERDHRHDDPLPQLAQMGEEGHAALVDVLRVDPGGSAFLKNITRPRRRAPPTRAG